jgi:20S proteasome alpha/beta subunit
MLTTLNPVQEGEDLKAVFFAERYYTRTSVHELVLLAAHTILQASKLNPASIEGLEIVVCTKEGFKSLSDSKIGVLKKESDNLGRRTGNSLRKQHI